MHASSSRKFALYATVGILFFQLVSAAYNYSEVLGLSFLFYEAQRSGKLPAQRVTWRKDSMLNDQYEGQSLAGGYFDAGDHTKFTFPLAFAVAQLSWGLLEFRSGYKEAQQEVYAKEAIKWGLDWLLKASPNDDDTLVVLVGDPVQEHAHWQRPEDDFLPRPAIVIDKDNPGTDAWCAVSAALAAGSIVFKKDDPEYSATLSDRAVKLYGYALKYRGLYSDFVKGDYYESTKYEDDLAWASIWLWQATGKEQYLDATVERFKTAANNRWVFVDVPSGGSCTRGNTCYWTGVRIWNWNNMYPGVMMMLAAEQGLEIKDIVWTQARRWLKAWMEGDEMIRKTPKGLSCARCQQCGWGANRNAANAAFLAAVAAKFTDDTTKREEYRCWAQKQIDYLLGDSGRSLVVGYGNRPPLQPHHRAASCPDAPAPCNWDVFNQNKPNHHILSGALVSGQCNDTFIDDITNFQTNEVAVDMNAGFTGALAALADSKNQCRSNSKANSLGI